ncbi:MAG: hypothetical protein HC923_05305 [Myxococcales bacterium]|nr:hypothetical protein [Myxococcales bacterium]
MNAKDLLDRADGIFFEGEVAREWIEQLEKRVKSALKAASSNRYFEEEWKPEYQELNDALDALNRARESLQVFEAAVARREGRVA